jgi:RNA recognition motif-containing protein
MRMDCFTLKNDGTCSVEFASEEEAKNAIDVLSKANADSMFPEIVVTPMNKSFVWGFMDDRDPNHKKRNFYIDDKSPYEAFKPLFEGRRTSLAVQLPRWLPEDSSVGLKTHARKVIEDHFGKYGIESISQLEGYHKGSEVTIRRYAYLDFTSTSGADQAIKELNNTEILGRKVRLQKTVLSSARAHQVGRIDPALLAELQEKGLVSTEPFENKPRRKGQKD